MLFNSFSFLVFFPVVVIIYFIIPRSWRYIWLLIASYYFYMSWNPKYALLMALSTGITFLSGYLIERIRESGGPNEERYKKYCVAGSMLSNLLILAIFKYANFAIDSISMILGRFGITTIAYRLDILLPVGISFYTFQALSYTMDVYRGEIRAEKNFLRYALFVSFFPQLVAGPIERSGNLLTQMKNVEKINVWNFERIRDGLLLMFWGLFQKLVIADRASILVNQVYNDYTKYGFMELATATVLFAFQIYCDFGGYSNIARGAAKVMGFSLMQNFRQPYLAVSIKDFWRRWHVSLTSWFTDYLYIPLGGNRKGTLRKYFNIFVVFAVSGLWHGASWNYVVWGMLHAAYQIIGDMRFHLLSGLPWKQNQDSFSYKLRKIIGNFILVDFAWIFFAANNFTHALEIIKQMTSCLFTTKLMKLGLDIDNWAILIAAVMILTIVDILHEKKRSLFEMIDRQELWFRWILYLGLIWVIIMLGIYGVGYDASQFIYFQF